MSNIHANAQKTMPGFWKRLAIGIEEASISYQERLEMRIDRLESEVKRLSELHRKAGKS